MGHIFSMNCKFLVLTEKWRKCFFEESFFPTHTRLSLLILNKTNCQNFQNFISGHMIKIMLIDSVNSGWTGKYLALIHDTQSSVTSKFNTGNFKTSCLLAWGLMIVLWSFITIKTCNVVPAYNHTILHKAWLYSKQVTIIYLAITKNYYWWTVWHLRYIWINSRPHNQE